MSFIMVRAVNAAALFTTFIVIFVLASIAMKARPITLTVRPTISFAPATVQPQIRIEPNESNRVLVVGLYGAEHEATSRYTLAGDQAPVLFAYPFVQPWKSVPPGEYTAIANVYDSVGKLNGSAQATVIVNGGH